MLVNLRDHIRICHSFLIRKLVFSPQELLCAIYLRNLNFSAQFLKLGKMPETFYQMQLLLLSISRAYLACCRGASQFLSISHINPVVIPTSRVVKPDAAL